MIFSNYADKFLSSFKATEGCWLWEGGITGNGYGYIWIDGKMVSSHRFSWSFHNGGIPNGLFVCHKCDVKTCVNPDHLFLGTAADNMRDKTEKGRQAFGRKIGISKYSAAEIEAVIARRATGETLASISKDSGMSMAHISDVFRGKVRLHDVMRPTR